MSCGKTFLTEEVKAVIGATADRVEASLWGVEKEGLRRFTQAIMDPDPRYWDEDFAKTTKFGKIVTPPIYCTYLDRKTPPAPTTRSAAHSVRTRRPTASAVWRETTVADLCHRFQPS